MKQRPHPNQRLEIKPLHLWKDTLAAAVCALLLFGGSPSTAAAAETLCATVPELERAFKAARPGDVILMREGVWTDADLKFEAEGAEGRPISLRAATPGKVVLTGRSRVRMAGGYLLVDGLRFERCVGANQFDVFDFRTGTSSTTGVAHHSRLTNCAFIDCNPPDKETNTRYVSLHGTDNRVDHCYLAGKTNLGPSLVVWLTNQPVRHQIDHNHFGPRPPLGFNGGETIRIGDSKTSQASARCTVEFNLFTSCDGEVEIISNKSCDNIYRSNTFRECAGTLTLRHGHRNLVEGNFFFGNHKAMTGGVRIINYDQRVINNYLVDLEGEGPHAALCMMNGIPNGPIHGYDQVTSAVVAFNTLVNCRESFVLGYKSPARAEPTLSPRYCTFANNIVVSAKGPLIREMTEPVGSIWVGNLIFGAEAGIAERTGVSLGDPQLVVAPDGLWRPGPKSPARGAAIDEFEFTALDMDGQPRKGRKDSGADQQSGGPILVRPLSPEDVGPAWRK
jgi:poly(beta-D-mannuronate) lyase